MWSDDVGAALLAFIRLCGAASGAESDLAIHLRAPKDGSTVWVGSDLGQTLWASNEGQHLLSLMLQDEQLRELYSPPPDSRLIELRGRIASFVVSCIRSASDDDAFVLSQLPILLDELRSDARSIAIWLIRGANPPEHVALHQGLFVAPLDDALLEFLTERGFEGGAISAPADATAVYIGYLNANRDDWGAFTAGAAAVWSEVLFHELSVSMWLATGTFPRAAAKYSGEEAAFPAGNPYHVAGDPTDRAHDFGDSPIEAVDGQRLREAFWRLHDKAWSQDESAFDLDTAAALQDAVDHTHSTLTLSNDLFVVLHAYAMIEGLLSRDHSTKNVVTHNVANVIAANVGERRRVRKIVEALYEIRSSTAHGQRPRLADVGRALETTLSSDEVDWLEETRLLKQLAIRAMAIARRVLAAVLWVTIDVEQPSAESIITNPEPRWTRERLLEYLDRMAKGDNDARTAVHDIVPDWLRSPI